MVPEFTKTIMNTSIYKNGENRYPTNDFDGTNHYIDFEAMRSGLHFRDVETFSLTNKMMELIGIERDDYRVIVFDRKPILKALSDDWKPGEHWQAGECFTAVMCDVNRSLITVSSCLVVDVVSNTQVQALPLAVEAFEFNDNGTYEVKRCMLDDQPIVKFTLQGVEAKYLIDLPIENEIVTGQKATAFGRGLASLHQALFQEQPECLCWLDADH